MRISAISPNTNFGKIYVTAIPKRRKSELETKASSLDKTVVFVNASDLYKNISPEVARHLTLAGAILVRKHLAVAPYLKEQAEKGRIIDYIVTGVDADLIKYIPESKRAEYLATKNCDILEYNTRKGGIDAIVRNIKD